MAGSDLKSATATTDGVLFAGRARLRHVMVKSASSGSPQLVFKNGGASGTTLIVMDFVISSNEDIAIPDEGLLFENGIYVDVTDVDRVTVFYS
jgi:hypothetical protein